MILIALIFVSLCLLLLFIAYRIHFPNNYDTMRHFHGPPKSFMIGNTFPYNVLGITQYLNKNCQIYRSPICYKMLQYYYLQIFQADHMEVILKNTENLAKGSSYDLIHDWLGNGLLTSTGNEWHKQRKILTPTFHFKILKDFVHPMNEHSAILIEKINNEMKIASKPINICPLITLCTLDIICETSMGKRIHAQNNASHKYVKALYEFSGSITTRAFSMLLSSDFIYYNFTLPGRRSRKALKTMHKFTRNVILERENEILASKNNTKKSDDEDENSFIKKRPAFLDLLIDLKIDGQLSFESVREQVDTFMFEGHDTTSSGLTWTCYCLAKNPEFQKLAQQEIDAILGPDLTKWPTYEDIYEMKYLECCIKEAMRLYAPVPAVERLLEKSIEIDSKLVPAGVLVELNIFNLHRNPEHFPNPLKYDPERFEPEASKGRHPFAYCPFSAGPRNCIGQKFALMEEKVVMCHILRNFTMEATQTEEETAPAFSIVLRPMNGMWIKFNKRF